MMADIKTTMDIIFSPRGHPNETTDKSQSTFSAIQAEADRRSRFEQSQIEIAEQLKARQTNEPTDAKCQTDTEINERELTKWLRETWVNEGNPGGTDFFDALKKYVNKPGSPIVEHYTASKKGAGIRWNTGNATRTKLKKTIQNRVSVFQNE